MLLELQQRHQQFSFFNPFHTSVNKSNALWDSCAATLRKLENKQYDLIQSCSKKEKKT